MAIIFAVFTFISTFLGGLFALRFKDKLHLILGLSAGAVVGVAIFDLVPESIELASKQFDTSAATLLIGLGFVVFMILDRMVTIHAHTGCHDCENEKHSSYHGAIALIIHSLLDGFGIGLAFKISPSIGFIVAAAVLAHDFSDGLNTVNYILKNKGKSKSALIWLIGDAVAPAIGVLATYFITVSEGVLGLILAVFCGFFLYIGMSDLVPESHHRHPTILTTTMTILGMALIYFAVKYAGI